MISQKEKEIILQEIKNYELFHFKVNRLIKRSKLADEKVYFLLLQFFPNAAVEFHLDSVIAALVHSFRPIDPIHMFSNGIFAVAVSSSAVIPMEVFESRIRWKLRKYYISDLNFYLSYAISPYESTNLLNLLKISHNRMKEIMRKEEFTVV